MKNAHAGRRPGARALSALVACLALSAVPARAAEPEAGDAADAAAPWSAFACFKGDLLRSRSKGYAIGNLGVGLTADAGALWGWTGTTLHVEALLNAGGKPNARLGSAQGISNIEVADSAARLYAAYVEHHAADHASLLFGLYDLNSEFYATPASGLLVHPSFGIGPEFAQTGGNGPSIFPNLGLALRGKLDVGPSGYAQMALIDGVSGDPEQPGRTVIHLSRRDGLLWVAEAGWQQREADADGPGRMGVGVWGYTRRDERMDGNGRKRNRGIYAIAQGLLHAGPQARTTGFLRLGWASPRVNSGDLGWEAGVTAEQPFGAAGPVAVTAGIAALRFGADERREQARAGSPLASRETAFEVSARWEPSPSVALQPFVQRILDVGGQAGEQATIAGLRIEWSWASTDR